MTINITDEIHNDFIISANETNNERAFPDVRDGLKPSQRACLWEMYIKGYTSNKPHVKSAKVDGGVIANWHPHGSEYLTFARMSQNWINNICEVDWHGANGSQMGSADPAASRYTECRLSKAAEEGFFENIKKDTVDMQLNFSEDLEWPKVFPAIFPRLFINGSQGIGYTIAQEWEPNNLSEFIIKVKEYINTGKITFDNIYPDYPTGGIIINKNDISKIYETGKGNVILRAKTEICDNIIKILELPYQVYAEPLIQEIKDLVNAEKINGIDDIYNKSDDTGLLIEIECTENPNYILNKLFKLTDLQCTFSANQMALLNGKPELFNLEKYIQAYINHNITCLQREYTFELLKAKARKEIVDGLLKAILNIDSIINIIKKSSSSNDATNELINVFNFTINQAKAIIELKLGKLAHLESVELKNEQKTLQITIDDCTKILSNTLLLNNIFIKRLETFEKKYGFKRHTAVCNIDIKEETDSIKINKNKKIEYNNIVLNTATNTLKKLNSENYKKYLKTNKDKYPTVLSSDERLVLISNKGIMYKLDNNKIPQCSSNAIGLQLDTLYKDKIIAIYSGNELEEYLFMITKAGLAKKIESKLVFGLSKIIGAPIMKVENNDEIIYCDCIDTDKIIINNGKKDKVINTDDFIPKGRLAGGVVAIKPAKGFNEVTVRG